MDTTYIHIEEDQVQVNKFRLEYWAEHLNPIVSIWAANKPDISNILALRALVCEIVTYYQENISVEDARSITISDIHSVLVELEVTGITEKMLLQSVVCSDVQPYSISAIRNLPLFAPRALEA